MGESLDLLHEKIVVAAEKAVNELIKVLESKIIMHSEETPDITADKMKNAAAAKRLAFEDALAMVERMKIEQTIIEDKKNPQEKTDFSGVESFRKRS